MSSRGFHPWNGRKPQWEAWGQISIRLCYYHATVFGTTKMNVAGRPRGMLGQLSCHASWKNHSSGTWQVLPQYGLHFCNMDCISPHKGGDLDCCPSVLLLLLMLRTNGCSLTALSREDQRKYSRHHKQRCGAKLEEECTHIESPQQFKTQTLSLSTTGLQVAMQGM